MSTKELILVFAAVLFLAIAIYAISLINKLNIGKPYKAALYYISIIIPILGLFLVIMAKKKNST